MNKTGLTPRLIDTNIFHLNSRYFQIRREERNMVHIFCSLLTGALFKVDSIALKIMIFTYFVLKNDSKLKGGDVEFV